MKILNFENFLNESISQLNEAIDRGEAYLIGDSMSILLGTTRTLRNKVKPIMDISIEGIGTYAYAEVLEDYKKDYPETKFVFLSMGANDLYRVDQNILRKAAEVRKQISRIFPNAQKFVVKAGSWGWGGLRDYGTGNYPPEELTRYYEEVWEPLGFLCLEEYVRVQFDRKDLPTHPQLKTEGVEELAEEILSIVEGKKDFYREDIQSLKDLRGIGMEEESVLSKFYDVLQNAVHENLKLYKQSEGDLHFDPVVERSQVGLNFLGYPLPKFGADGIFGDETLQSVREYKKEYEVEGDQNSMDDYFFISLIGNLKDRQFSGKDILGILDMSYKSIEKYSGEDSVSSNQYIPSGYEGDDEYLIFVQHNQGVAGATSLVNSKFGKGTIHPFTRSRGMVNNIPRDLEKDFGTQIREALASGDDKRAATLFLEMWKMRYGQKKEQALQMINTPKYADIKVILEKASAESGVPFEVLATIANIESSLNPKAGNSTYKGLFALNPSTAVKYNPALSYTSVYDPVINAQAGYKMLSSGKEQLAKALNKSGVLGELDFA
jgi:hypothetical protein